MQRWEAVCRPPFLRSWLVEVWGTHPASKRNCSSGSGSRGSHVVRALRSGGRTSSETRARYGASAPIPPPPPWNIGPPPPPPPPLWGSRRGRHRRSSDVALRGLSSGRQPCSRAERRGRTCKQGREASIMIGTLWPVPQTEKASRESPGTQAWRDDYISIAGRIVVVAVSLWPPA